MHQTNFLQSIDNYNLYKHPLLLAEIRLILYHIGKMAEEVKLSVVDEEEVDTVIGSEIEFEGDIESSKSLMIKGKVSGNIDCSAELYITEQAEVRSTIHAATVVIRGKVYGDISADSLIAVLDWGHVEGRLVAPDIYLSPNCVFKGTTVIKS